MLHGSSRRSGLPLAGVVRVRGRLAARLRAALGLSAADGGGRLAVFDPDAAAPQDIFGISLILPMGSVVALSPASLAALVVLPLVHVDQTEY